MKGKIVLIVLLVLSVVLNLFLIFSFIDKSITIDYSGQHTKSQEEQIKTLCKMLEENISFKDNDSALSELKQKYPDKIVKQEGDTIFVDEIGFKFVDGRFKSVITIN